jgi:hypothetical protein
LRKAGTERRSWYTLPPRLCWIYLSLLVPAGVGTGAGAEAAANPDANSQGWETTLTALREHLAAVVWEGNGGYCDVQINIYQRTYEPLSEGSVTPNLYRLSAVLDFSETELGLAAPDSTSFDFDFDGVSDIVRNVLLELASPPLETGSLHRQSHDHQPAGSGEAEASAGSESAGEGEGEALPFRIYLNGDGIDADEGEVAGAGDEEDDNVVEDAEASWLSIAKLAGIAQHTAATGSADYALEVNVQLHLPTHNRPDDTVHCLAFDHAFYARLVERLGEEIFLSTTWVNPTGYTVIDGEYPEDFDHEDEDEDEDENEI